MCNIEQENNNLKNQVEELRIVLPMLINANLIDEK